MHTFVEYVKNAFCFWIEEEVDYEGYEKDEILSDSLDEELSDGLEITPKSGEKQEIQIRKNFPESWLFEEIENTGCYSGYFPNFISYPCNLK